MALKLVAWYQYSPGDLRIFELQFNLLSQTLETLAEFVQGPCDENQRLLARERCRSQHATQHATERHTHARNTPFVHTSPFTVCASR